MSEQTTQTYQHWRLETDADQIGWLTMDRADSSVNSLNREVFNELDAIVGELANHDVKGVIIRSGKKKGFIAGADISQFTQLETADEAYDLIRQAQIVLDKLEALPMPTCAMINGFCLGGGTELSLACTYRVAADHPNTKIGLPEVNLGIHPGWGGTVRLPRLVGAVNAMTVILTGRPYSGRAAKKIGMVDDAVPLRQLERAARYMILKQPKPHRPSGVAKYSNEAWVRPMLGKLFYKQLASKKVNRQHYPAPFAVVKNWIRDGAKGNAMVNEAKSIADLMVTETSRNLVRLFFLQTRMKSLAKDCDFKPKRVHVIGAGTMGGDIAAWCAYKGMHVTLQDQSAERVAPAIKRAFSLYKKKLKKPNLVQAAMDRLQPDLKGHGIAHADVIIEAIFEDVKVKQDVFADVEAKAKPDAILATNTSSIPLEEIATALKDPARLVGIHFFNPVAKMQLVEVVHGKNTSVETADKATAFVTKISRLPLPVASSPGFLVNRILMPYLMEAMELLEEGVPAKTIDKAAMDFGMPMGPITLADIVGLDVCLMVAQELTSKLGGKVPERLVKMVEQKKLGVKTGCGFYRYKDGKKVKSDSNETASRVPDVCDRMILRMLNETAACLHEEVITDQDLLDCGMVFGTGFAPFRGGPIHYAKARGLVEIVAQLEQFSKQYGERFRPKAGWDLIKGAESQASPSLNGATAVKPTEPPSEKPAQTQHDFADEAAMHQEQKPESSEEHHTK